jgi:3-phosphoglycerate kinase
MGDFPYKTLEDLDCKDKRVLVRSDLNVPLENGYISDDRRIKASLPTIEYLRDKGAKVIVMSHLGRPGGEKNEELSLKPVAEKMTELLQTKVMFSEDCIGDTPTSLIEDMEGGDLLLLENTRFYPGEKKNDLEFAKKLAELADYFVNDAFGTAHRSHASNVGVAKQMGGAYCGFLMRDEIIKLSKVLENPEHPLLLIIGGAKAKTKLGVVKNMLGVADSIIISGNPAFTVYYTMDVDCGNSKVEKELIPEIKEMLEMYGEPGNKILLPIDHYAVKELNPKAEVKYFKNPSVNDCYIEEGYTGVDIGPLSIGIFAEAINDAKTIIWNGPPGVFEWTISEYGTKEIASAIADSDAYSVVGGGDTIFAIEKFGFTGGFDHISTGGGSMLEFLEGKKLPGIETLIKRQEQ